MNIADARGNLGKVLIRSRRAFRRCREYRRGVPKLLRQQVPEILPSSSRKRRFPSSWSPCTSPDGHPRRSFLDGDDDQLGVCPPRSAIVDLRAMADLLLCILDVMRAQERPRVLARALPALVSLGGLPGVRQARHRRPMAPGRIPPRPRRSPQRHPPAPDVGPDTAGRRVGERHRRLAEDFHVDFSVFARSHVVSMTRYRPLSSHDRASGRRALQVIFPETTSASASRGAASRSSSRARHLP